MNPDLLERLRGGIGRVGTGLQSLFTGPDDPNLSPEQNESAKRQAMVQAGLASLMASGPNPVPTSFAQVLAQSALSGRAAGSQLRQQSGQANVQGEIAAAMGSGNGEMDPTALRRVLQKLISIGDFEGAAKVNDLLKQFSPTAASLQVTRPTDSGSYQVTGTPDQVNAVLPTLPAATVPTPEQESLPADLRATIWAMGLDPDTLTPEQRQTAMAQYENLRRAGGTSISVNTGEQTARGVTDIALDDYRTLTTRAGEARSRLNSLAVMKSLLDSGMPTGSLDSLTMPLRGLATSLGMGNVEQMGQQELFNALSNQMALLMKEGMTGPMSDRDIIFLQAQVPQLRNTPAGNRMLVEILSRTAQRQIELQNEANRYIAQNGALDHRWFQHQDSWGRSRPLFDDINQPAPWR